jgi:hypothetical protein
MFSFFRKSPSAPALDNSPWRCRMGWQVVTYQEGDAWLSLQVEPMKSGPCRVYVPGEQAWAADAPAWAASRRSEILERMRQMAWNRELVWIDGENTRFWHRPVTSPVPGSIESTPGGQQLESMWLFHAGSPGRFTREQAKRAWFAAVEQMCLQVAGPVKLDQSAVIPGSVFQEIVLPTLRRNPKVTLSFAGAR